ncbi:hypothetical protein [Candidatus Sulfurimonas baltica]|uniref:Uncharacterized protein n=1 Tax=Candidatus Sulfurimonas baltica TaxID=2740404 RepID=A0A7S7LXP6_9BACT|nr:hypothetical protein [Candidatus Sulfurimonas baltica]QOY53320.1 hypothetical protein HUE88_06510 [Candidatus Sulfurimonas baltica]
MDYKKSVELALSLGYEEVSDENAYKGKYFIKHEKIWIHNIEALKLKLKVTSNEELDNLGYDVENYHRYKKHTNKMADNEMKNLYANITHLDGEATYLYDGMWLLPDGTMEER